MPKVRGGSSHPLGSSINKDGVNFAVYSENADSLYLDLFRTPSDSSPYETIQLERKTNNVWHCSVAGLGPGTLYNYRAFGRYIPEEGHRFNSNKLLIDPYARAICGTIDWSNDIFGYRMGDQAEDLSYSDAADSGAVPKSSVVDSYFDWDDDLKPENPWPKTVIYETHVKGLTQERKDISDRERGTYLGLSSDRMIQYFEDLGITAVELMPVQHRIDNKMLVDSGLNNYWGYNTIGFFAPDVRFASSGQSAVQVAEFKEMVKTLHRHSIEVIMDVVYNHTAEGNHLGPTVSFRGLDNAVYYRLMPDNPRFYVDYTGTGNTLNVRHPQVLKLIMDSLRYWITEMHVDGFRFDLAAALARQLHEVDNLSAFFDIIHQDPVISRVKLIAEPWDVGPGGYQVGNFPVLWAEWNGKYRDCIRRFWRGDDGLTGEFATRISGSPDLYESGGRRPHASINYITAHDGFTIFDLVSYNERHNEANMEGNQDGSPENYSTNFGVEGWTDDPEVLSRRVRRAKNLILTLLVSQGAPMILGGDEILRTQRGNNNAYCQDNELSWYDWAYSPLKEEMRSFLKRMLYLRNTTPCLRRREFFSGNMLESYGTKDVYWFRADGGPVGYQDWPNPLFKALQVYISGKDSDAHLEGDESPDVLLMFNAGLGAMDFYIPTYLMDHWTLWIDSFDSLETMPRKLDGQVLSLPPDSSAVLVSSPG